MLRPDTEEVSEWNLRNEPRAVRRLAKRLSREAVGELQCVYEARPCGYTLQRQLLKEGISTDVLAPSLIPVKPGERIKTDRRDARKLAAAARAQMLTMVRPRLRRGSGPGSLLLPRGREDLTRARHRLKKFLMRRGFVYRAGKN